MKNILFYKYVDIGDTERLRESLFELAQSNGLLGTILIANEGINGCLSGKEKGIAEFIKKLKNDKRFSDIKFKEGLTKEHNFKRLSVRVRGEVVTLRAETRIENRARYIEPKQFKTMLDTKEDIVLLDARNDYEHKIGKFKDAMTLDIETFRQFPNKIEDLKKIKNKKIVTYCTGGIRCEKASALLKENGFKEVYQLHGGILKYGKDCGNAHWQGKCFVFDTRGAIDINPKNQPELISQCSMCNLPCADYHNCARVECDKRFIACDKCLNILENCCSKQCRNILKKSIPAEILN